MRILGAISEERLRVFELGRAPEGWSGLLLLGVLAALGYAVVWFYRREARAGASLPVRIGLAGLRCAVILLLAGIWLDPSIATYTRQTIRATVAVLVDDSASMSIADAFAPPGGVEAPSPGETIADRPAADPRPRIERVADFLSRNDGQWLQRLATRNELRLYSFGERAAPLVMPLAAAQSATDLGQALTRALEDAGESPLAAVIVFSDGGLNRGLSAEDVALLARRSGVTLYPVAVGEEGEPPNLRITSLAVPATVPLGDPVEVRVQVAGSGVPDSKVRVDLLAREERSDPGSGGTSAAQQPAGTQESWRHVGSAEMHLQGTAAQSAAERQASDPGEGQVSQVRFVVNPERAGEFVYRAVVTSVPGEALLDDNSREASVQVTDQPLRVLIVAGRPSFDYRFVSRLFERDRSIDVSCWLQSADARAVRDGDTPIGELPRRPEELFQYDAVLLLDPDPRELDTAWAITVRRLVDELGGGLLLAAGPLYTGRLLADPRLEELTALLPIVADPDPAGTTAPERWQPFRTAAWPLELVEESAGHPLVEMIPDPERNRALWRALPGTWWHMPVLRAKPLASVLLRHSHHPFGNQYGPAVLMAVQPFGAGRTGFLGFDSSWRWRATGEPYFNRFWIQTVRYLALARRQSASRRGTIVVDRESLNAGEFVGIEARVLDESFAPWHEPEISARLEFPDGSAQELVLPAIAGREGWYGGRVALHKGGTTAIRIPLPGDGASSTTPAGSLVKRVRVFTPDREMTSLRLHARELRLLAEQTGGRFVRLEDADPLPDWIENATVEKPPAPGPRASLWDNAGVLGLLTTLLATEWLLRRRNHLL